MKNIMQFLNLFCIFFCKPIYSHAKIILTEKTPEKILNFNWDEVENLPSNYETIQIWYPKDGIMISMHDRDHLNFYAFGKNIEVPLKPLESNIIGEKTVIWLAQMKNGTYNLEKLPVSTIKKEFEIYATSEHTVIGTGFEEGVAYFAGKVGNFTLLPLKKETSEKLRRRKRDIDNELLPGTQDLTGNFILSDYHIIYISSEKDNTDFSDAIKSSLKYGKEINSKRMTSLQPLKRTKRNYTDQQEIIYLQILLYTDFGSQFNEAKGVLFNTYIIYLITYWNCVYLNFGYLENPRVSFKITGIIIGMDPAAVPFFVKNHVGFETIYPQKSLDDMNRWFNQKTYRFPKNTYDIAVTMTSRTMVEVFGKRTTSFNGVLSSIADCKGTQLHQNISAIIHDNMDYSGISTSVTGLAYLLNVADKSSIKQNVNMCNPHDGATYFISTKTNKLLQNKLLAWMYCSQQMLSYFPIQGQATCFKKKEIVDTGKPIPNILPGEISSLNKQCQRLGYSYSCKPHNFEVCKISGCYITGILGIGNFWKCENKNLVLDGTQCGENKYCYAGKCVPYAKNKIFQIDNK